MKVNSSNPCIATANGRWTLIRTSQPPAFLIAAKEATNHPMSTALRWAACLHSNIHPSITSHLATKHCAVSSPSWWFAALYRILHSGDEMIWCAAARLPLIDRLMRFTERRLTKSARTTQTDQSQTEEGVAAGAGVETGCRCHAWNPFSASFVFRFIFLLNPDDAWRSSFVAANAAAGLDRRS
jgi:hypothetical protein